MDIDSGRSGAEAPSGLRPFGAEPAAQSQAEPLVPNARAMPPRPTYRARQCACGGRAFIKGEKCRGYVVFCARCGAEGGSPSGLKYDAVYIWNHRSERTEA